MNFICQRFGTPCLFHFHRRVGNHPPVKMVHSLPKRWHIKFRRRGITQKKAYNIQNTANFEIKELLELFTFCIAKVMFDYPYISNCLFFFRETLQSDTSANKSTG